MAREMKDSGIEWIGKIPKDWEIAKNKYLLKEIYSGGTPTSGNPNFYDENGIPFVSIGDMKLNNKIYETKRKLTVAGIKDKNLRILNEDTILYSIYATIGNVSQLGVKSTISQALLALILNEEKYRKNFYKYNLIALKNFALSLSNGNTQNNLNAEIVKNFFLVLASLEEQEKIANYLDKKVVDIDLIIEKTKATIEDYKKYKQSIITEAVTKGLNPNVEMKDSEIEWIGQIPKQWTLKKFKNILIERNEKNIPIKTSERLSLSIDKGVTLYSEKTTNLDRFKEDVSQYKIAHINDLVLNSMNMIVGAVGVSKYFGCVSPVYYTYYDKIKNSPTPKFCNYLFSSKTIKKVLFSLGRGIMAIDRGDDKINTCRLKVSRDDLRSLIFPIPSLEEQQQIVDYLDKKVSEIDNLIAKKESLISEMEEYKKSLIYECVTGKKEVI
jgi:type I restriction enzyme S subunit